MRGGIESALKNEAARVTLGVPGPIRESQLEAIAVRVATAKLSAGLPLLFATHLPVGLADTDRVSVAVLFKGTARSAVCTTVAANSWGIDALSQ